MLRSMVYRNASSKTKQTLEVHVRWDEKQTLEVYVSESQPE